MLCDSDRMTRQTVADSARYLSLFFMGVLLFTCSESALAHNCCLCVDGTGVAQTGVLPAPGERALVTAPPYRELRPLVVSSTPSKERRAMGYAGAQGRYRSG